MQRQELERNKQIKEEEFIEKKRQEEEKLK
jgi:hypothetical protein